jgi:hypothetical protein
MAFQLAIIAQHHIRPHHTIGADFYIGAQLGGRIDDSGGMNILQQNQYALSFKFYESTIMAE